jgi:hypothetical protein
MTRYLFPALLLLPLTPACAGTDSPDRDGPNLAESRQSVMTLESLTAAAPIIRGFVADGTGCATLGTPVINGNSITFILTDYIAEKEGTGLARATCDLAVEINLPAGVTISLDDVIYRGFADGSRARSTFFREYFFAGTFSGDRRFTVIDYSATGVPTIIQNDSTSYMSNFGEFTASDQVLSVGSTPCGMPVIWRSNTSMSVRNTAADSFSLTSIDTVDVTNKQFITFDFGSPRGC